MYSAVTSVHSCNIDLLLVDLMILCHGRLIYCISGKLVQAEATALLNLESQSTENSSAAKVVVEVQLLQEEDFKMT